MRSAARLTSHPRMTVAGVPCSRRLVTKRSHSGQYPAVPRTTSTLEGADLESVGRAAPICGERDGMELQPAMSVVSAAVDAAHNHRRIAFRIMTSLSEITTFKVARALRTAAFGALSDVSAWGCPVPTQSPRNAAKIRRFPGPFRYEPHLRNGLTFPVAMELRDAGRPSSAGLFDTVQVLFGPQKE